MSVSNLYPGGDNPVTVNLGLALYDMSYEMAENFIILDAAIGSGSGVTSVFSRTGAVVANANDYAAVASLVLGDGLGDDLAFGPAVNHIILGTNNAGYLQFLPTSFSLNDGNNTTISSTSGVVTLDSSGGTGQFQGNWNFANNTAFSSTITDGSSSVGTSGQVLSSTVTGVKWVTASSGTVTSVTGTANQIVATGTANVVLSIANPFTFPGPASMGSNYISETRVVSAGGTTTAGLLVKTQPTGNVQTAALGDVSTFGVAITTQTSGQNVEVARIGLVTAVADNTITIGDIMVVGTVTAGRVSDSGQTSALGVSNQLQIVGKALTAAVAGGTFTMQVYGPGFYGDQDSFPLTVANGVSGGIPYFSSTTTEASSALLAATGVVIGGGAGTAPATTTHLTFASDTLAVGLAGTSSGVLALTGSTSGAATITAPAVAGTTTNAVLSSNNWSAPVLIATAAGAASLPSVSVTGAPFTGGTGTTTVPLVYINDGTAPTTWSTSGTALGINLPSASTSNFLDFHLNGGVSNFSVSSNGTVTAASSIGAGGNITAGAAQFVIFNGRAKSASPTDGVIELLNSAATGFTRLDFGGTTSSFAALQTSATTITAGLADGTAGGIFAFSGHVKGNADTAGQATITAASTTTTVTFAASYTSTGQPIVTVTPTSDPLVAGVPVGYWVTYTGGAGAWTAFTINIQTALAGNVTFNYHVMQPAV